MDAKAFASGLNQHGYSFHQRVIAETAAINDKHRGGWNLLSVEQPVTVGEKSTRTDFILSYRPRPDLIWLMVAECKRVNPAFGTWCFARGAYHRPSYLKNQLIAEVLRFDDVIHSGGYGGENSDRIYDIGFSLKGNSTGDSYPVSQDKDALEAACSQVSIGLNGLLSTIYKNEVLRKSLGNVASVTVVPVIFTTAKLLVSDVSLKTSDLYTGNLNELPEVNEVDWVYFQYSQSSAIKHEIESKTHINDSWDRIVARDYVRTIAVVSPSGIESYLRGGWVSF